MSVVSLVSACQSTTIHVTHNLPTDVESALDAYRGAATIREIEATGIPAKIHEASTDAVRDFIKPIADQHSTAPAMIYRHWSDLTRALVYGPRMTRDAARELDPESFRALIFLEGLVAANMARWTQEALQIDPTEAHKIARKIIAKPVLEAELAKYRLSPTQAEKRVFRALVAA